MPNEIPYTLIRMSRKTLSLQVNADGEIIVRSPHHTASSIIEDFVAQHRDWIQQALVRQQDRRAKHPPLTEEQVERYREKAKQTIPPRVAHYAALMGVTPTGIRITNAQKRFGSCSVKNSLCFSLRLMDYPDEAIDYVIVHELSHIIHHDHSPRFWTTVATYMPDYKQRQQLFR